jgi:hypothetical protein
MAKEPVIEPCPIKLTGTAFRSRAHFESLGHPSSLRIRSTCEPGILTIRSWIVRRAHYDVAQ